MRFIDLTEEYPSLKGGTLTPLCLDSAFPEGPENWKRPAVIIVPGGAYMSNSKREGEPVAARFLAEGFQTFVFHYLTASQGVSYPEELLELASAVDYVKRHAEEYFVNPDEIFAVGFSAGGHLVGNLAQEMHSMDQHGFRGNPILKAIGLAYPVINPNYGHRQSHDFLLQGYDEKEKEALMEKLSLDLHVSEKNPPAYLFASVPDTLVPVRNVIAYAEALGAHHVNYEMHLYPYGDHGWGPGDLEFASPSYMYPEKRGGVRAWTKECASFFRDLCIEAF